MFRAIIRNIYVYIHTYVTRPRFRKKKNYVQKKFATIRSMFQQRFSETINLNGQGHCTKNNQARPTLRIPTLYRALSS